MLSERVMQTLHYNEIYACSTATKLLVITSSITTKHIQLPRYGMTGSLVQFM